MEGSAVARKLSARTVVAGGYVFAVATSADEHDVRELLRTNSVGGWIRLSFQREPDAYAGTFGLASAHDFVLARVERSGALVGVCERSVRAAFVDGCSVRLPYLGALRVAPEFRHRIGILRHGYAVVRQLLQDPRDLPYALTAITADNAVARRLLSAGVPGLPTYVPIGELSTFAIRTRHVRANPRVEVAAERDLPAIASLLQRSYREYQFAPHWHLEDLEQLARRGALRPEDYLLIRRDSRVVGCIALWDQRVAKQTIVSGYSPWIGRLRPVFNVFAPLIDAPTLPPPGSSLRQLYLSHLAVEGEDTDDLVALVRCALSAAKQRGIDVAVLGLATTHSWTKTLRHYWRVHEYRSVLHVVQWSGEWTARASERVRLPHPEIALL